MAPVEVIDLLSSEDESPTKLLQSFKGRPNQKTLPNSQRGQKENVPNSSKGERLDELGHGPHTLGKSALQYNRASSVQMREDVSPTGFKTFQLYAQPASVASEEDADVEGKKQSFTPPVLSNDAWRALGPPGLKLQQDMARIQRNLAESRTQHEAKRQERIQKADLYQQQRRMSAAKAGTASEHAAGHPTTSVSQSESDALLIHILARQSPESPPEGPRPRPDAFTGNRVNGLEDANERRAKRSFDGPAKEVDKRPKTKGDRPDTLQRRRTQIVDTTDPKMERLTTSPEPDVAQPDPSKGATQDSYLKEQVLPSSSSPTAPEAARSRAMRPWSVQEDMLLKRLKETEGLSWDQIESHFPQRTRGSLQVRYTTGVKGKRFATQQPSKASGDPLKQSSPASMRVQQQHSEAPTLSLDNAQLRRMTAQRHAAPADINGHGGSYTASNNATTAASNPESKRSWQPFTMQENALLKKMKGVMNLKWPTIHAHFPGRSLGALQVHYSTKVKNMKINTTNVVVPVLGATSDTPQTPPADSNTSSSTANASNFGNQYTAEEVALLKKLKEDVGLDWKAMVPYFNGRTAGSLQVYWYTKIRNGGTPRQGAPNLQRNDSAELLPTRAKRARKGASAALDGFVSWADAKNIMRDERHAADADFDDEDAAGEESSTTNHHLLASQDTVFPRSLNRILHQRVLGTGSRAWTSPRSSIPDELKNHVYEDYSLQQYYHGTSGDVVGLSWSANGAFFAAGSVAITDSRSMQYNMSRNLLVGSHANGELQELIEHHVERPVVKAEDNPNSLSAMRQTQDPRLFQTVTATAFSPAPDNECKLFTTGTDKMLRKYSVSPDVRGTRLEASVRHSTSVDLLAIHQHGYIATGSHSASGSIKVFHDVGATIECAWTGSPQRRNLQSTALIYPSSLKWGAAHVHRNYLLAGFSGDEDKLLAGETTLWDIEQQSQIELKGITRNVFDVCWNPRPSSASIIFAVASNSTGIKLGGRGRTAVSCFAPKQPLSAVINWQCPALDINDILICPHDDNLIAAGATDGKVYVWDQRWAGRSQEPLHVLSHGDSLNILPHDREKELTDTGVRFLSWGATSSRLYSGSSDGIVKVWNPYRSADNTFVEDLDAPRQHRSAVMSGAFSPDYRELLIGTENGRINLFTTAGAVMRKPEQFKLHTAPEPIAEDSPFAAAEMLLSTGKIVTRPCGAMPISQAVQGILYDGPFQAPKEAEVRRAERNLDEALSEQAEVACRSRQGHGDSHDPALEKAHIRVRDARAAVEGLQDRLVFVESSRPKAEAFQRDLAKAREERHDLETMAKIRFGDDSGACQHDCAYLPTSEELEDNGRYGLRIPEALKSLGKEALATSRLKGEDEEPNSCYRCLPLSLPAKGAKRELCLVCKLNGMQLTTKCSKCSAPARVETNQMKQPVCEACSFACFRCSSSAEMSSDFTLLRCQSCSLSWEIGALGYELVQEKCAGMMTTRASVASHEQYDDFGTAERERLAGLWDDDEHE